MFEIHDDDEDDGFWEKLPLDVAEFQVETNPSNSVSAACGATVSSDVVKKSISDLCSNNKASSVDHSPSSYIPSNGFVSETTQQIGCQQLAPLQHNVLTSNRTLDLDSRPLTTAPSSFLNDKTLLVDHPPLQTAAANTSPCLIKGSSNDKSCVRSGTKRKFPGPAGVLPGSFSSNSNKFLSETPVTVKDSTSNEVFPLSQPSSTCDPFLSNSWQTLLSDIGSDAKSILTKFAIRAMLLKASKRILPKGKIPLVLAFVDSVDFHGCDGTVVLRDPSGKVQGALHYDLIKDPSTALKAGCVLILRQTSVISPTPRTHYLNITPANIVLIYSQAKDLKVSKSPWSPTSPSSSSHQSLTQIIQESENELTSALIIYPPHQMRQTSTSNPSPPSLFRGITNTTSPAHRFPLLTQPSTNNNKTPIYNKFKCPVIRHTAASTIPSPSAANIRKYPINPLNLNNSTNSHSQPKNPSVSYKSTAKNNQTNPTVHPFKTGQISSSCDLTHPNCSSTSLPPISKHLPLLNGIPAQMNSIENSDFFDDDDTDFLSLCDDSDLIYRDEGTSSSHQEDMNTDKIGYGKKNEILSPHSNISSLFLLEKDKCLETNSDMKGLSGVRPFSVRKEAETSVKRNDSNGTCRDGASWANDATSRIVDSTGGRDVKVQLGVSKTQKATTGQMQHFSAWDDDLSDELLSQL